MKSHPTSPAAQTQIMLRLSLKGVNAHAWTCTRTRAPGDKSCVSKQSKHIMTLASEGVHQPPDLHKRMQPVVFTFAKRERERDRQKERERGKKITAVRHETFQLKCNFHPHCCRMKPGKQQKKGIGWDMTEKIWEVEKKKTGSKEKGVKDR